MASMLDDLLTDFSLFSQMMRMDSATSFSVSIDQDYDVEDFTGIKGKESSFEFDLDLLPATAANGAADCQVPTLELPIPDCSIGGGGGGGGHNNSGYFCDKSTYFVPSPTNTLSPLEASAHSPTMFSPGGGGSGGDGSGGNNRGRKSAGGNRYYAPISSPVSLPPNSPSITSRRLSSTDSVKTSSSGASSSTATSSSLLQDSLAEFAELQHKVKLEHQHQEEVQVKTEPMDQYPGTSNPGTSATSRAPPPPYPVSGDEDVSVKMEPVLSLAVEQVRREIEAACRTLKISNGKSQTYYCTIPARARQRLDFFKFIDILCTVGHA